MSLRLVAVMFDAQDPYQEAEFWGSMLGRDVVGEDDGALLRGNDTQVGLRFVPAYGEKVGPDRLHLHLTTTDRDDEERSVAKILALGGRYVDVGQLPEEDHTVLADPGGDAFCVIGPGNNFLAGCGHLGEVTCDGTREVGLFWRDALGWPLVWDEDEETAVQAPAGGTKVSWGGPPVEPRHGRNRQRFDLEADDLTTEVARLIALGATRLTDQPGDRDQAVELADPDGNEFLVRRALTRTADTPRPENS